MKLDFLNTISIDEGITRVVKMADHVEGLKEVLPLGESLGRVIAKTLLAEVNLPDYRRSTVDGYAVKAKDVFGATPSIPSLITIKGEVFMGEETSAVLKADQAIYVPTGGMVPEGAECMVMIEDAEKLDDTTLLVYKPSSPSDYIAAVGEDVAIGDPIIELGKKISPYDIGLLAGMGIDQVEVFQKPSFTIISTGDEIIDIHQSKVFGQIRDINGYSISALIQEMGGEIIEHVIIHDDFEAIKQGISKGFEQSECVVLSGGSSVGVCDYTKSIIESYEHGEILLHGLSVKPGKPTIVGKVEDKAIFGLPGHPVSALMVCQHLIGAYMSRRLHNKQVKVYIEAELLNNVHGSPGRDTYQMVKLIHGDGQWLAKPIHGKSGMMNTLAHGSGYFRIDKAQEGIEKGEMVKVYPLQEVRV